MTDPRDDIHRLQSILDALEEMWLRLPDAELPIAPAEAAQDAKIGADIIQAALRKDGQRRMEATRRAMEAARAGRAPTGKLLGDPITRRRLLEAIIANDNGKLPERLTVAFRDGKELTDAEVESILAALDKLGLLKGSGDHK